MTELTRDVVTTRTPSACRRTLVVVLGQLRGHSLTWENFKRNVLEQLDADLAVCVPDDTFFDPSNAFYANAKFRWLVPDAPELSGIYDHIHEQLGAADDWRVLCDIKGSWLGRISASGQKGAAALLYVLRWYMLRSIKAAGLDGIYDRFVITRSDFYYLCPHPPIECLAADRIWIPDGEDYGGFCDRHLVVSAEHLVASCSLIDDLLLHPNQMRDAMIGNANWNIEQLIAFHFSRNGLISRVDRFPYIMFLVRGPEDPTAWSEGEYVADVGMMVKYTSELYEAERFQHLLRSNDDWRKYFVARNDEEARPARIYTSLGTLLYIDSNTGELRHGSPRGSPDNLLFIGSYASGRMIHRRDNHSSGVTDHSSPAAAAAAASSPPTPDASLSTVCDVEQIPLAASLRGGPKRLVALKVGDDHLRAEANGRLVFDRASKPEPDRFRLVHDFHATSWPLQRPPGRQRFLHQSGLFGWTTIRVEADACEKRPLTLSARNNGISGWYGLKITRAPPSVNPSEEAHSAPGSPPGWRIFAYLFVPPNVFASSVREVVECLDSPLLRHSEPLAIRIRPIGLIEYIWRSIRRRFLRQPSRFLRYFRHPSLSVLLMRDFPRPPPA